MPLFIKSQVYKSLLIQSVLLSRIFICVWTIQGDCDEEGAVRLDYGGNVDINKGRLEICASGEWGTVCGDGLTESDGFDINAARVVCRQLGVAENDLSKVVTNIFFGGGDLNQTIHLDNLLCTGTETSLLNCTHSGIGEHDCEHNEDIGIICRPYQSCRDGDVRLVDGDNYNVTEGRVEYCVGGLWGTVCNYLWGDSDTAVVCRQLGLNAHDPKVIKNVPQIVIMETPIVLDGVTCQGTESKLSECDHFSVVEECSHSDDAGANCTSAACKDSDVRLYPVDGSRENEGLVQYCHSGQWGVVCYDDWDNNDATVVCRQLGFNVEDGTSLAKDVNLGAVYGQDHPRTLLNKVDCINTESCLSQCPIRDETCSNSGAGVICPLLNVSVCTEGDVRLQDGILSNEIGRVEVCVSGQWGLVCDDHWDDRDASVVCRQLGYTGGIATPNSTFGGIVNGDYFLNDVNCTGNEIKILNCLHPSRQNCGELSQREDAGVICGVTPGVLEKCTKEHTNKTVSVSGYPTQNLTVGKVGTCQKYLNQSSLCRSFHKPTDYVFINAKVEQTYISSELDRIFLMLRGYGTKCSDLISRVLCHYFFAPCGASGLLHLPLSVCSEECYYVESTCAIEWRTMNDLLRNATLGAINCNVPQALLEGLTPCCINAGIEFKNITTTEAPKSISMNAVIGILAALVLLLVCVVIVICFATLMIKRRKTTIRNLQLDVLSSPATSVGPRIVSFRKSLNDFDFGDEVKIRNNGSRKMQHAVPNPYSNKQELASSAPLLMTPSENKMMNRISSSIIRELSSNMLIPYTRLKLMECVGQGEFGVVYKAQYTEPEGDIGYKTSIVAVKTLKGFFDNNQINKIMEESIKMKHFDHPNVLHLIGVCLDAGPAPYVVMPYMANGSLLHYLKKERDNIVLQVGGDDDVKLDVRKRLTVMCLQIASGMEYLAGERFVHRDLAARNCMIDIHFVIKIADFGLSEDIYAKNYFRQSGSDKSVKLPVKWMAPESLSDGVFSEKTDVWSFGVTCWEIFSGGKTPYPGVDPLLLSQMLDAEQRLNKPLNAACPDEMCSLMMSCWTRKPNDRPSFSNIVKAISNYTEVIAGYLDVHFNPFDTKYHPSGNKTAAETPPYESPRSNEDTIESTDVQKKIDSKTSNSWNSGKKKSIPSNQTTSSPSPLLHVRKLSEGQLSTSSAGISIHIESPSEEGSIAT